MYFRYCVSCWPRNSVYTPLIAPRFLFSATLYSFPFAVASRSVCLPPRFRGRADCPASCPFSWADCSIPTLGVFRLYSCVVFLLALARVFPLLLGFSPFSFFFLLALPSPRFSRLWAAPAGGPSPSFRLHLPPSHAFSARHSGASVPGCCFGRSHAALLELSLRLFPLCLWARRLGGAPGPLLLLFGFSLPSLCLSFVPGCLRVFPSSLALCSPGPLPTAPVLPLTRLSGLPFFGSSNGGGCLFLTARRLGRPVRRGDPLAFSASLSSPPHFVSKLRVCPPSSSLTLYMCLHGG